MFAVARTARFRNVALSARVSTKALGLCGVVVIGICVRQSFRVALFFYRASLRLGMLLRDSEAQHRLLLDLSERRQKIDTLEARIRVLMEDEEFPLTLGLDRESTPPVGGNDIGAVLFTLGQAHCFDANRAVKLNTLAEVVGRSSQFARPRLRRLDDAGIIETVTRKPLRFRLAARGVSLLELDGE